MSIDEANRVSKLDHIESAAYSALALVLDVARRHQGRCWRDRSRPEC